MSEGPPLQFGTPVPSPAPHPPPAPAPRRGFPLGTCLVAVMFGASMALNLFLFLMLLGAMGGFHEDGTTERLVAGAQGADKKIVVIPLKGVIADGGGGLLGPSVDIVERAISDLRRVRDDREVVAVILDVNSPGGGITDCDRIHHEILELRKARPELKFVSLMRDVAASGGYYVSAPCDKIIAHPTTITGSIGVIMSFMNLQGLFEKIGYREEVFKSGVHKDIGSMNRPMTEEERALLQSMLLEMYDRFVQVVADGRKMDPARVRELADGRIYTGTQAKANGLVDELGYFDDALATARALSGAPNSKAIEFQRPFTLKDIMKAEARPPSAETVLAAELGRFLNRRGGFYYIWTMDGAR